MTGVITGGERELDAALRRGKSAAFRLARNSTARRTVPVDLWGTSREVYANANLSVYSAERCNARCPFCVEELRPASRGRALSVQRSVETDDARYFAALDEVLRALRPLAPSVSVTGGEPSKDPRLPRVLRALAGVNARKRTVTTNGSGLFDGVEGRTVLEWITGTGVRHLNVSRAHPDDAANARLMRFTSAPTAGELSTVARRCRDAGTRLRLSCVLLRGEVDSLDGVVAYLEFARSVGVDNVIFRQLMKTNPETTSNNSVVRFSEGRRAALVPILEAAGGDPRFSLQRQIVGYYYYVEVFRYRDVDVVFEEADLAQLERAKAKSDVVHELVFHPNATLASTWQPWDGVLGPGRARAQPAPTPARMRP